MHECPLLMTQTEAMCYCIFNGCLSWPRLGTEQSARVPPCSNLCDGPNNAGNTFPSAVQGPSGLFEPCQKRQGIPSFAKNSCSPFVYSQRKAHSALCLETNRNSVFVYVKPLFLNTTKTGPLQKAQRCSRVPVVRCGRMGVLCALTCSPICPHPTPASTGPWRSCGVPRAPGRCAPGRASSTSSPAAPPGRWAR